uniref:Uncharacterized protein n=1 Tax=Arundo donax TaxID=35708 RepID=A0A0A9DIX8_ARUDO
MLRMMSSMFMDPMPLPLLKRASSEDPPGCRGGDDDAITRDDAMRCACGPTGAQRGARGLSSPPPCSARRAGSPPLLLALRGAALRLLSF